MDSMTGLQIVERGFSRKLAYLRKTSRVAIGGLHEIFFGHSEEITPHDSRTINRLYHEPGATNFSDVLSKALDVKKHWVCCAGLGLVAYEEVKDDDGDHYSTVALPTGE